MPEHVRSAWITSSMKGISSQSSEFYWEDRTKKRKEAVDKRIIDYIYSQRLAGVKGISSGMSQDESGSGITTPRATDLEKLQGLTTRIKRSLDGLCAVVEEIETLRRREAVLFKQLQSDLTRLYTPPGSGAHGGEPGRVWSVPMAGRLLDDIASAGYSLPRLVDAVCDFHGNGDKLG